MNPADKMTALLADMRSLQLSTTGQDNIPHCGYTPYVHQHGVFYIFTSQLAVHTRDMLASATAAIMVIADEQSSSQIFARTRVSYYCTATRISPEDGSYKAVLDEYENRHGNMVGLLRQLPDFVLFRLQPVSGQFVMGFGKAFKLTGEKLSEFEHARSG